VSEQLSCSLPIDEADRRVRETRSALAASVKARDDIQGGMKLRFPADPAFRKLLQETVEAESRCCPFLDMRIRRTDEELELTVTGPPDAKPMIELLFS
jgi:hypothetical protein